MMSIKSICKQVRWKTKTIYSALYTERSELTIKVRVNGVLQQGSGAEVDELHLPGAEVDENVLVFDVPVHYAAVLAVPHGLQHLAEKAPRQVLRQGTFLGDEVEQVLDVLGSLHYDDEAVRPLEPVQHLDNAAEARPDFFQQDDLHWDPRAVRL